MYYLKILVNEMNNNDYDYIVSDGPVVPMLEYIHEFGIQVMLWFFLQQYLFKP